MRLQYLLQINEWHEWHHHYLEHNLPLQVFDLHKENNIFKAVTGQQIGTRIV